MRVRIVTSIAGAQFVYSAGEIVEVEDDLARKWIRSGVAELPEDAVEVTTFTPGLEQPTRPRPVRRRPG